MRKVGILCVALALSILTGSSSIDNKSQTIIHTRKPIRAVKPVKSAYVQKTKFKPCAPKINKSKYSKQDLYYLTACVYQEARSAECSDLLQRMVANVVINRVNDPDFDDTIYKVLTAKHQYGNMWKHGIYIPYNASKNIVLRCRDNAKYILDGNKVCPKSVVYQSEYKSLGSGTYRVFKTSQGNYYFNYK